MLAAGIRSSIAKRDFRGGGILRHVIGCIQEGALLMQGNRIQGHAGGVINIEVDSDRVSKKIAVHKRQRIAYRYRDFRGVLSSVSADRDR